MRLTELQQQVDTWIKTNGGYWDQFQILARLTEELGEISSDLQRIHGLRPRKTEVDLGGEIGDLLFTLAAFANACGVDLEQVVSDTLAKYDERDAKDWQDAGSETCGS